MTLDLSTTCGSWKPSQPTCPSSSTLFWNRSLPLHWWVFLGAASKHKLHVFNILRSAYNSWHFWSKFVHCWSSLMSLLWDIFIYCKTNWQILTKLGSRHHWEEGMPSFSNVMGHVLFQGWHLNVFTQPVVQFHPNMTQNIVGWKGILIFGRKAFTFLKRRKWLHLEFLMVT